MIGQSSTSKSRNSSAQLRADPPAGLVVAQPVAVGADGAADHLREGAVIVGREGRPRGLEAAHDLLGKARADDAVEEAQIRAMALGGVEARARGDVDLRPRRGDALRGPLEEAGHLGGQGRAGGVLEPRRNAEPGEARVARRRQLDAPGSGVLGPRRGEHRERELEILRRAREGPEHVEVRRRELARGPGDVAAPRDDAVARLVAVHAAEVRRIADRAADVAAELEGREPGGEGRRRAAARAADSARRIPRIVRGAVDVVVGLEVAGVERRVGLAEDHGAGLGEALGGIGAPLGEVLGEGRRAAGRRHARDLDRVLHGEGQAAERAAGVAASEGSVGGAGTRAGGLEVRRHHGVQRRVHPLETRGEVLEQLRGRELARAERPHELRRAAVVECGHAGPPARPKASIPSLVATPRGARPARSPSAS